MSNQWFNIRFGKYHWQFTRDWEISFLPNDYWYDNPDVYAEVPWLEVYCAFGKHF